MILNILQYGSPQLREKSVPVIHITNDILKLLADMEETLAQGGIGLAAPQVGENIQLVTINISPNEPTTTWLEVDGEPTSLEKIMPLNFVNPVLHPFGKKIPYKEGCLSIPKVYATIMRRSCVKAELTLMNGRRIKLTCNGLLARCLQHEVDHLNGGLFTDLVSETEHDKLIKRLRHIHPNAFEEDDDSYARRMKEERRKAAQMQQGTEGEHPSSV